MAENLLATKEVRRKEREKSKRKTPNITVTGGPKARRQAKTDFCEPLCVTHE